MYTAAEILPLWKAKLPDLPDEIHQALAEALAEFSVEVAGLEREACAKVVEAFKADMPERVDMIGYRTKIAAKIRARETPQ